MTPGDDAGRGLGERTGQRTEEASLFRDVTFWVFLLLDFIDDCMCLKIKVTLITEG